MTASGATRDVTLIFMEKGKTLVPLTTLDSNAALVLIDLQKGIAALPAAHPIGEIIDHAAQLARAFRQ